MTDNEILSGASRQWRLQELIAQGDAGELYLVESVRDGKIAILKRPGQSAFPSDIQRQAHQIEGETNLLNALRDFKIDEGHFTVRVTSMLDQSLPGTETTSQFFIVLEKASGVPLSSLSRIAHFGLDDTFQANQDLPPDLNPFVHSVGQNEKIPPLVLLRSIRALLDLLEAIHSWRVDRLSGDVWGILWNDVKPDHIFWDPDQAVFTIIDWGNGQFLDKDGISQDRRHSSADDYRQLFDEIGRFLSENSPELYTELNWSACATRGMPNGPEILELNDKLTLLLQKETSALLELRQRENYLLSTGAPNINKLYELSTTQTQILSFGELPDYKTAEKLHLRSAASLASQENLAEFIQVCQLALDSFPIPNPHWKVLESLAMVASQKAEPAGGIFLDALRAGANNNWPEAHWHSCLACVNSGLLQHWSQLSAQIRRLVPEIAQGTPLPYQATTRLLQGLEEEYKRLEIKLATSASGGKEMVGPKLSDLEIFDHLLRSLKDEILAKWIELDPTPPASDLSYTPLDNFLNDLQEALSSFGIDSIVRLNPLKQALSQPQAQTAILLDTWKAKGFQTAGQSLRYLLLWDPDRLRVLRADQAIQKAQFWLEEVRSGPQNNEKLMDYAIRMEHTGRLLRSQVGQAPWIDTILSLFARLRSGARPGDLVAETPALIDDFPWMKHYQRKPVPVLHSKSEIQTTTVHASRQHIPLAKEGKLGQEQDLELGEPLDTWVPEARGSSARVFLGALRLANGKSSQAAIKIMRPDKIDYALPLFWEEVQVLSVVGDLPGVSGWLECGFLRLEGHQTLPPEALAADASTLNGKLIRYGTLEANAFLEELGPRTEAGWLPYLALEKRPQTECLLLLCDEGQTKGKYLPVEIGVQMAVQICAILDSAHARNVVYRDHKILHYYWGAKLQKISMIDWNVAKWHPSGVSEAEIQADLVQFGARALHHILTGRPAPGALPVGPTRPDEIEMAPQSYSPAWTYDDSQRLSAELQNILSELLSGSYTSASKLGEDLLLQLSFANQLKGAS